MFLKAERFRKDQDLAKDGSSPMVHGGLCSLSSTQSQATMIDKVS